MTISPETDPTNLTAKAATKSQINLSWAETSSNEMGFAIERCTGSTCTDFVQIETVGADVKTLSNTVLSASTVYRYRVRAFNNGGYSLYTNIAAATTPSK